MPDHEQSLKPKSPAATLQVKKDFLDLQPEDLQKSLQVSSSVSSSIMHPWTGDLIAFADLAPSSSLKLLYERSASMERAL